MDKNKENDKKDLINNFVSPDTPDQNDIINNNHGESGANYNEFVSEEIEKAKHDE